MYLSYFLKAIGVLAVIGVASVWYGYWTKKRSPYHTFRTAIKQYAALVILRLLGSYTRWRLEKDCHHFRAIQDERLLKLLGDSAETKYGKAHKFGAIHSREDYVSQHPLTRYDHYRPYVDCLAKGEQNVITKGQPFMLALTSGTSGQPKVLPALRAQRMAFLMQGVSLSLHTMYNHFPESYSLQRILKIFYTPKARTSEGGLAVGPISSSPKNSAVMLAFYSTPLPGLEIMSEPEALYVHLLFGLKDPLLGIIEANFVSIIYSAFVELERQWERLVGDIERGELCTELEVDPEIRSRLEKLLSPDPERAADLRREFEKGFTGIARRIWPSLRVILTVDSGAFKMYSKMLKETYAVDVPVYSPIYGATEGLIGVNIWPDCDARPYLLSPRSMFYEFIPIDQSDQDQPETLFADQVKKGETYEMVITNISGLFRYRFGDVVRVIHFHGQCPVVEYLYRQGQLLDVRGEKVSEDVLQAALDKTCTEWGISIRDYTVVESPSLHKSGEGQGFPHYVVFIEPMTDDVTVNGTRAKLDANLKKKSFVYRSFREKGSIDEAVVRFVAPGTFKQLRTHQLANYDVSPTQWKTPRVLRNDEAISMMLDNVM